MAEDEIDEVLAELRADGLYVHSSASTLVTESQQTQIEANLALLRDADTPVVIVVEDLSETGRLGGDMDNLLVRVHDRSVRLDDPLEGTYLGTQYFYEQDFAEQEGIAPYVLTSKSYPEVGTFPADYDALDVDEVEFDLGDGLVLLTGALASYAGGSRTEWDAYIGSVRDARSDALSSTGDGSSGSSGDGAGPEVVIGVGVVLALVVGAVLLGRRRTHGGRAATAATAARQKAAPARQKAFALPPSAVELVRAARDAKVVGRGRAELLALGEAIDAAELTSRGNIDSWQAALDHYDAARRVLRPEDPAEDVPLLDGVGGLVLAERGRAALAAALRGRAWSPAAPCFLNPLHGAGSTGQAVEIAGERTNPPLCTRCRRDLKRGARPEILDVMVDGAPRHYFEAGAQPWSTTGFGALDPDLVTALHRVRR